MNELQTFTNQQFGEIRTIKQGDEILFVAVDVCRALEVVQVTNALRRLDDDEKALISIKGLTRGNDNVNVVNEYGLYNLVLSSRKSEAKAFKRWVTHEVLPAIRKTGSYERKTRRLGFHTGEYFKAAEMVSKATPESLPYVLNLLRDAGMEIPEIQQQVKIKTVESVPAKPKPAPKEKAKKLSKTVAWSQVLNIMKTYTLKELEVILGISASTLSMYRLGHRKPLPKRRREIIEKLMNQ